MKTEEREKMIWKRQHGILKCRVCKKKLKRFPSKFVYSEVIDGQTHSILNQENSGHRGIDTLDLHLKCLNEVVEK